jgi:ribosomal protein L37AE/L43A
VSDDYNQAAFNLIVGLRGGLPEKCDFCDQPFTERRYPVPEEAGEWTCSECVARWIKNGDLGYAKTEETNAT